MAPTPFSFRGPAERPSARFSTFLHLLIPAALLPLVAAQQQYEANAQTDCYGTNGSSVLGYTCSKASPRSCTAYLAFRSAAPYSSPVSVSYLLNATATAVAAANAVPAAYPVADSRLLLVPVPCACTAAGRYQHDASYVIQFDDETYFTIANETYQGLATCQALMAQNADHDSEDLYPNITLHVPLRCACPSAAQAAAGVRYLVTYLLGWDDDSNTVADRFRANYQTVLDANSLYDNSTVYPFTTMLVPLKGPPKSDAVVLPEAPTPAPAPEVSDKPATSKSGKSSGGVKWRLMFGVGTGCGVLVSVAVLALFLLCRCCRRRHGDRARKADPNVSPAMEHGMDAWREGGKPMATPPWMMTTTVASVDVRDALASLTMYEYAMLEGATAGFAEENRIGNSSVYRAVVHGDAAAVKRVAGDVGAEVAILGRVNHSCLVRLSGLCVHRGDTHLVFEFAENGALSDWLHGDSGRVLGWRQRVQVALDVADGLNYLHNYTSPPYVHKNLKSSNVLLDSRLRAKVSNFGLARSVADAAQMTRHVVGTEGYLAPEYLEHGLIGPHLDVFAFGVVVLELLSGKEAAPARVIKDEKNGETLLLWQEAERVVIDGDGVRDKVAVFVDARLRNDYPLDVAFALLSLALRCVAREPRLRPMMGEVLLSLSALHGSTLQGNSPYGGDSGSTLSG